MSAGTFTHNNGRVVLSNSLTWSGSATLNELNISATGTKAFNFATGTTVTANGAFTLEGTGNLILNGDGVIAAKAGLTNTNTGTNGGGTATILVNGTGAQALAGNSTVGMGRYPKLTFDKASGTLTVTNTVSVGGNFTYVKGTTVTTGSTFAFGGSNLTIDAQGATTNMNFNNVAVTGNTATTAGIFTVGGTLDVASGGTLELAGFDATVTGNTTSAGTLKTSSATGNKTFGNLTISSGGAWDASTIDEEFTINGNAKAIRGTLSIPRIEVDNGANNASYTNYGSLTVSTSLRGAGGTLAQGDSAMLRLGILPNVTDMSLTTLNASAAGNTVEYNLNTNQDQEVFGTTYYHTIFSGSGAKTLRAATTVNGNLAITGNAILDVSASNYLINIKGNWTNSSLPGSSLAPFNARTGTVTFTGTAPQTITSSAYANGNSFYNLTFNNTSTTIPQILVANNDNATGTLTLTAGNIDLGSTTFTLGFSTTVKGTLVHTAGYFLNGTFKRWFNTTAVTLGNVAGRFPMGYKENATTVRDRSVYLGGTAIIGGTMMARHSNATGNYDFPAPFQDNGTIVDVRHNMNWTTAVGDGLDGSAFQLRIAAEGMPGVNNAAMLRIVKVSGAAPGTSISGGGTTSNPYANKQGLAPSGKGLLIPRMTQLQRTTILIPGGLLNALGQLHGGAAQGLIVYQTDGTQGFYYNTSTTATPSWSYLSSGGSGATGATGPTGSNGSAGAAGATGPTGSAGAAGATGVAEAWLTGSVAPTGGQGSIGDWYYRTSNNEILEKTASTTWTSRATITGATGATGSNGSAGSTGPTGAAGAAGTTGAVGATGVAEAWLTGSVAPTGGQGSIGDWYYRTSNNEILEKTASTTWTSRATITGATGATGAAGSNGAAGATGPTGAAGTNGAVGATGVSESWLTGAVAPTGGQGIVGDWYYRTSNNEVLEKTASTTWTSRATIIGATGATGAAGSNGSAGAAGATGATGTSTAWYSGNGNVGNGQYNVGDWYLRTSNGEVYEKTGSLTWTLRATFEGATGATGPTGPAGGGSGWSLTGNSGTTAGTNFVGTTDSKSLVFKINNAEAGYLGVSDYNAFFGPSITYTSATYGVGIGYQAKIYGAIPNSIAIGATSFVQPSSGTNDIAIGYGANVSGGASSYSLALGNAAQVQASNGIAIGKSANVNTQYGIAIGDGSQAQTNAAAMAIGKSAYANGADAIAFGTSAQAQATGALALGEGANVNSANAIAIGSGDAGSTTQAQGTYAISIGYKAYTNATDAIGIGDYARAQGANAIAIGANLVFTTVLLLTLVQTKAQLVSLNLDGSAPNTNAQLDIKSTGLQGKGLLIPRMTQLQRTVVLIPGGLLNALGQLHGGAAQGLIVYQTDGTQGFYYNTSTTATPSWSFISSGGSGATGATGPTGANGSNGSAGSAGATGPTGAAGVAESWLTGAVAPTGGQGSVGDWYFRTSNNEILEKTASTTWTSRATVIGATGATGAAGANGSNGSAGATGATGAAGSNGAAGATGAAGAVGATGAAGATGTSENWLTGSVAPTGGQGAVGDWYFRTSNNEILEKTAASTWTSRATIIGATGATGANGSNGAAGATGAAGSNGSNGATGATGPTGAAGSNGSNGSAGATGATGAAGSNGAVGATGPTGATGSNGAVGAAGATGAAGTSENWLSGAVAPTGGQGAVGDWYFRTSNNEISEKTASTTWTSRATITGATGATGAAGSNGSNGAAGATGPTGAAGSNGAAGAAGATGATGVTEVWLTGSVAPTGGQGNIGDWYFRTSNSEVLEKTASTTWTSRVTITGATGATGAAGSNGAAGATGAAGPAGATGPAGSGSGWSLTGNSSTNPGTNFIGTTDNKDFVVKTNGTERIRVTDDGKVGIGTNNPVKALDLVLNSSGTNVMNITNTNIAGYSSIDFFNHTGGQMCNVGFANSSASYGNTMYFATNADIDMTWAHNNTEVMRLGTGGMLGIGTSSPSAKLHVNGTFRLVDGTEASGKVLTSDGSGNASWQTLTLTPDLTGTTATLNTTYNDYAVGTNTYVKANNGGSSAFTITGIVAGGDGKMIVIQNSGSGNMTIKNNNSGSTTNNRIITGSGADIVTSGTGSVTLIYDTTQSKWVVISVVQ
ncbi:unnamed protein product [Rotaria sordida]|uniref:Uncharacterized protein n=1 Tax=Rotaria sordida TaxID=392033 RepID=A0A813MV94_9BILA|nr:unnamed protein product [Rotaria sordida]